LHPWRGACRIVLSLPSDLALCLAKRSYTCEINDLEYSLIRSFPLKFLP